MQSGKVIPATGWPQLANQPIKTERESVATTLEGSKINKISYSGPFLEQSFKHHQQNIPTTIVEGDALFLMESREI